jgi:predicted nucleic acid-binding protein
MPTDEPSVPLLVADTNLFVAHLFRPRAPGPAAVLGGWRRGELRLCVSDAVLAEIRATLRRLPVPSDRKDELLDRLADPEFTNHVAEPPDSGFRTADPTDDKFLHLALAAGADALLTSDRALLEVENFPVPIVKSGQWSRVIGR